MIKGIVASDIQGRIEVSVYGPSGQDQQVSAVVDTGFTGLLMLPLSRCVSLGLPPSGFRPVVLADGNRVQMPVYPARVIWDRQTRNVIVLGTSGEALVGMSLLYGSLLTMEIVVGGSVTIEALP